MDNISDCKDTTLFPNSQIFITIFFKKVNSQRSTVNGQQSMINGQQSTVNSQQNRVDDRQQRHTRKKKNQPRLILFSDSNRIQTCNLRIRSAMLYSVELWSRCFSFASAKVQYFSELPKYFTTFLQSFL